MIPKPEYQVQTRDPGGRDLWKTVASYSSLESAKGYRNATPIGQYNMHPPRVRVREYTGGRARIVG